MNLVQQVGMALKHLEQRLLVNIIDKVVLAPVTAGGEVIDSGREFDAPRTGHAIRLRWDGAKGKA